MVEATAAVLDNVNTFGSKTTGMTVFAAIWHRQTCDSGSAMHNVILGDRFTHPVRKEGVCACRFLWLLMGVLIGGSLETLMGYGATRYHSLRYHANLDGRHEASLPMQQGGPAAWCRWQCGCQRGIAGCNTWHRPPALRIANDGNLGIGVGDVRYRGWMSKWGRQVR